MGNSRQLVMVNHRMEYQRWMSKYRKRTDRLDRNRQAESDEMIKELHSKVHTSKAEKEALVDIIKYLEQQVEQLHSKGSEFAAESSEHAVLFNKLECLLSDLGLGTILACLKTGFSAQEARGHDLEKELATCYKELKAYLEQNNNITDEMQYKLMEVNALSNENQELKIRIKELEEKVFHMEAKEQSEVMDLEEAESLLTGKTIVTLQDKLDRSDAEMKGLESTIASLHAAVKEMEDKCSKSEKQVDKYRMRAVELESELKVLRKLESSMSDGHIQWKIDKAVLEQEHHATKEQLVKVQAELVEIEARNLALTMAASKQEVDGAKCADSNLKLNIELELLKQDIEKCQLSMKKKENDHLKLMDVNKRLEEERTALKGDIVKLEEREKQALARVEDLKSELLGLREELSEGQARSKTLEEEMKRKCCEYESLLEEICDEKKTLSREKDKLEMQSTMLERALELSKHDNVTGILEEKVKSLQIEKVEMEKENRMMFNELAVCKSKCQILEEHLHSEALSTARADVEQLRVELARLEMENEFGKKEKELVVKVKGELEQKCTKLRNKLEQSEVTLTETMQQLEMARVKMLECKSDSEQKFDLSKELARMLSNEVKRFEEASAEWKARETQLLTKLEKSKQNAKLQRTELQDVREELERNRETCVKYQEYIEDLEKEAQQQASRLNQLMSSKGELEEARQNLQGEVKQLRKELADRCSLLQGQHDEKLKEITEHVEELEQDKLELAELIHDKEQLIESHKVEKSEGEQLCQRLRQENERLRKQVSEIEEQMNEEMEQLHQELTAKKRECLELGETLCGLRTDLCVLMDLCKSHCADLEQRNWDVHCVDVQELAKHFKAVTMSCQGLNAELKSSRQVVGDLQRELDERSEELKQRVTQLEEKDSKLKWYIDKVVVLQEKCELLRKQYSDLLEEKENADVKLSVTVQEAAVFKTEIDSLKAENKRLEDVCLTMPEGFKKEACAISERIDGLSSRVSHDVNDIETRVEQCRKQLEIVNSEQQQLIRRTVEVQRHLLDALAKPAAVEICGENADDQLRSCNDLLEIWGDRLCHQKTDQQTQCSLEVEHSQSGTKLETVQFDNQVEVMSETGNMRSEQDHQQDHSVDNKMADGGDHPACEVSITDRPMTVSELSALTDDTEVLGRNISGDLTAHQLTSLPCERGDKMSSEHLANQRSQQLMSEQSLILDKMDPCSFDSTAQSPSQLATHLLDDVHRIQMLSGTAPEALPWMTLQDLQEENAALFAMKTDLENRIMTLEADKQELKQRVEELSVALEMNKDNFKMKMEDFQQLLSTVTQAKEEVEQELGRQRAEFEANLVRARSKTLMELITNQGGRDEIIQQMSSSEDEAIQLRDNLRKEREEKEFIKLRVGHLLMECQLYQRHIADLEKQVEVQRAEIREAMEEHKETIALLAEIRLEQEMSRHQQRGDFSRIEEELQRLESHLSSVPSTPRAMSVINSPDGHSVFNQSDVASISEDRKKMKLDINADSENDEQNCGRKALEQKHFELVDELSKLNRELMSLKQLEEQSIKENRLLKEALLKERASRSQRQSSEELSLVPAQPQLSRRSSVSSQDESVFEFSHEMLAVKDKVMMLEESRRALQDEKASLHSKLREQEELVKELRSHLSRAEMTGDDDSLDRDIANKQIKLLEEQRDDLLLRVKQLEESNEAIGELTAGKYHLEDELAKERQLYREKCQEKEALEVELLRERLARERQMRDYQQLQVMIRQRERIDEQLNDDRPVTAEATERQSVLAGERGRLTHEIARSVTTRDVGVQVGDTFVPREYRRRSATTEVGRVGASRARRVRLDCGCQSEIGTMKMYAHCRYHLAVERLRRELRKQDQLRRHGPVQTQKKGKI